MFLSHLLRNLIKHPAILPSPRYRARKSDRAARPRLQDVLEDRLCPSGGYLLVSSWDTDNVLRYDETSGAFVDEFVPHKSGGLVDPNGIVFGPSDHNLYVSSGQSGGPGQLKAVLSYDGTTGAFDQKFADGGQLNSPRGIVFGPDGNLYVSDSLAENKAADGQIVRYNGATGAFMDDFVPRGSGDLGHPFGLVFGPDGKNDGKLDLYITNGRNKDVLRYDGTTGASRGEFVTARSGGLDFPGGLTFGPDGNLYVTSTGLSGGQTGVLRFDGKTGAPMPSAGNGQAVFVAGGSGGLISPYGVLFGPDGNGDGKQDLYVTSTDYTGSSGGKEHTSTVKLYDGSTGAYIRDFVTVDSGGLANPTFMTFTETDPTTLAYTGTTTPSTAAAPGTMAASTTITNLASTVLLLAPLPGPENSGEGWLFDPASQPRVFAQVLHKHTLSTILDSASA